MKVLFDTYKFALQYPGGGETIIFSLKEALENLGIEVTLFNKWEHKVEDFDIVHYFSSLEWRSFDGFKIYGPKLVLTPTIWPEYSKSYKLKEIIKRIAKNRTKVSSNAIDLYQAYQNFDLILPTTSIERDLIKKNIDKNLNLKVLENGVNNLSPIKVPGEDYYLYIGSIRPNKNLDIIMNAIKKMNQRLIILGDKVPGFEDYYKECTSIEGDFEFKGYVNNKSDEYIKYISNAKALINASDFETFSLVGIEAGILGTPVIMTKNGGTRSVYKDMVEYVSPKSESDIIHALGHINHKNTQRLQDFCKENYLWDRVAKKLKNYYLELLE